MGAFRLEGIFARTRDTALTRAALSDVAARRKIACTGCGFQIYIHRRDGRVSLGGHFCLHERYSPDEGGFVRCGRAVQNCLHRTRISNIYPQARWTCFAWRAFFARWRDTALTRATLPDVAARCKIACTGRAFKYPQARWARILRRKIRGKRLFSRSAVFKVRKSEIFCK